MTASWKSYDLDPLFPLGTSRGIIAKRRVWFLKIWQEENPSAFGLGEAAPLPGLSIEEPDHVEEALEAFCNAPSQGAANFAAIPSVRFAIEMAHADLAKGGKRQLFHSPFCDEQLAPEKRSSIPINGLVWMGSRDEMLHRLSQKIDSGYRCMKMKIGAIDREQEFELLGIMRDTFPKEILEIRVDANGAFAPEEAPSILERLAELHIHSIEQPIKAGQADQMAELCASSAVDIALDEELIGVSQKADLLDTIKPQFIILKPTLLGGFTATQEWIEMAEKRGISWWITSCLESNIGLNAIAQWTATLKNPLPQGLGTGALFKNNIDSPLLAEAGNLKFLGYDKWNIDAVL